MERTLNIHDYTYDLPAERIALFPPSKREDSRLLVYDRGQITHSRFHSLTEHLPPDSLLFFNDTKVIPARLHFQKETGAVIEIFLLHPVQPSTLLLEAMQTHGACSWQCTIGNLKRWTEGTVLTKKIRSKEQEARSEELILRASLIDRDKGTVSFSWEGEWSFAEIISRSGETPLPPYLKREAEASDRERYQTVYAHYEGAVAAPTAGLHFTPEIMDTLRRKNIQTDFLTLHVSAGTFQPVKVERAAEHIMHHEQIVIRRDTILQLLQTDKFIIPVGTTSMRTLESLYWYGVKLLADPGAAFVIGQRDPYTSSDALPSKKEALAAVLQHMDAHQKDTLAGETSIYIMPGYTFRICQALITNFHQPGSTLILLVAAFIGEDWKKIYAEALEKGYRFLSYGDSSLLIPLHKDH
jgi:S-adenosylmethionine:tRNA ribosyltransferase-isomerase